MHSALKTFGTFLLLTLTVTALAAGSKPASADTDVAAAQISCGTVDLGSATTAGAVSAFGCFRQAFEHCDNATLTAISTSGGDPMISSFSTYAGSNGCNISETVSHTGGSDNDVDSYVCTQLTQDAATLHFSGCGAQRDVWLKLTNG
jgi:hypothetical protein